MDTLRHVLGFLLVVIFPPALLYWLAIHPLAPTWRKLGAARTFIIVVPAVLLLGLLLYRIRGSLLGGDLGLNWALAAMGFCLYGVGAVIGFQCRRHLSFLILVGVPELRKRESSGKLLQGGIYGTVRHPRYLSFISGTMGFALIANHLGAYLVTLFLYLLLFIIIPLEERELLARFGAEYTEYRNRVPSLIPRFWTRRNLTGQLELDPVVTGVGEEKTEIDKGHGPASYYDLQPAPYDDVPFYEERIPSPDSSVLELGCGTGWVLVPLVRACRHIQGIDNSEAMVSICREKINRAGVPSARARADLGDITDLELDRTFDLIIAPYRVFQDLETEAEVTGLFRTVRKHLAPSGTCVLNVFKPFSDPAGLRREWAKRSEYFCWETPIEGGRVSCHGRNARMDVEKLILYPELIYRRWHGESLLDETVLKIAMRCYYPEEFEDLIVQHGFLVMRKWGGYGGEAYGEGPELVLEFKYHG